VHVDAMVAAWRPIVIAYLAVTIGRALVLYLVAFLLRRSRERVPLSWATVLTWGGLRGALSMVLVLGLPLDLRHRELIVSMTFGVVVLSILIQGTTMAPLLRKLGLIGKEPGRDAYERHRSALRAGRAGLAAVLRMEGEQTIGPTVARELRDLYSARIAAAETLAHELALGEESLREDERRCALTQALQAEKIALVEAFRDGLVGEANYEALLADVDARLVAVDEHAEETTALQPPQE
jgi:CPA1 family monovalent cation:H+ antiporter